MDARAIDGRAIDADLIDARLFIDSHYPDAGPRGPVAFTLPGNGNSVYWDDTAQALYLTDDTHATLVKWTDAGGFTTFGTFPTVAGGALGTIQKLADGSFLVPTAGNGTTTGTIFTHTSDGTTAGSITGLDATHKRAGLAQDPNHVVYEAYTAGTTTTGGVASLVITTGVGVETTITTTTALKKVVGMIATATNLYVCDQTVPAIYQVVIAGGATTVLTSPASCDQMSMMANGDLLTGGLTGAIYRVSAAGAITTIASDFDQPRGTSYDPTHQRLFIIEHSSQATIHDRLHIVPVDN